jgi:flagellar biosynthetic protein FliR
MAELLSKLAGGQLTGFILVLARVAPLFMVAPPFSSKLVPIRVRGIAAVAISVGLTPVAIHGQHIPSGALPLAELVLQGMLTGFGFAFSIAVLFAAIESAGLFVDAIAGFSLGSMIESSGTSSEGGPLSALYAIVGTLIFLVIGGDAWTLRGLSRTFQLVPLTSGPRLPSLVGGAEQVFSTVFSSALEIVAPVLLALLVTDVAFGVISRVVPQMNVFAVGFPAKIAVAVLLVTATMPFFAGWISEQLSLSVTAGLGALHAA